MEDVRWKMEDGRKLSKSFEELNKYRIFVPER